MRAPERGAALLEVLLALAITALLAAAATGVTRFGLTTVERGQEAAGRSADALILRRSVAEALTRIAPGASARGDADRFDWRGALPDAEGWRAGAWRLTAPGATLYRCAEDGARCERVESYADEPARFAYAAEDGEWRDEWPAGAAPALIRVTIGEAEIVVAPRVRGAGR